jgi:hypothetical protein
MVSSSGCREPDRTSSGASDQDRRQSCHASPQEAFLAWQDALRARQWDRAARTMTPDAQQLFALELRFAVVQAAGNDTNDELTSPAHIFSSFPVPDSGRVERPAELIAALLRWADENDIPLTHAETAWKLVDLSVAGDSANGTAVASTVGAAGGSHAIEFRRIGGCWYVHYGGIGAANGVGGGAGRVPCCASPFKGRSEVPAN